jgi:hypothetical protein
MPIVSPSRVLLVIVALAAAGCEGCDGPAEPCETRADCPTGQYCRDGQCVPDVVGPDGDADVDADVDADGDSGPECVSAMICGTPPRCCEPGEECVDGACLPPCASAVRCGEGMATCCSTDQVCVSGACVDPGDPCTDSFDCPEEAFCEPTLERCLPQFDPVTCESTPVYGDLEVIEEWSVTEVTEAPECRHPISAPVVVDLDGDARPEVISSFSCDDDWQRGVLRAFRGTDGAEVWAAAAAADQLNGRSSIAAGDLTGDGLPEIVAAALPATGTVLAFSPNGERLWESHDEAGASLRVPLDNGAPTLADLDGDGSPEVVCGATVLDAAGALVWTRDLGPAEGSNSSYSGGISAVADIDLDGEPEVVAGRRSYEADGTPRWTAEGDDGYPAVADFDDDEQPEIVLVANGTVRYVDGSTGALEWGPVTLPGGGIGGPPTVADFDADGLPEIGVAGAGSYTVYDPDGATDVLWSMTTQDFSSNTTGSSVFDFEGDGAAEVVYGDECYMRVYRGTDGAVLLRIPSTSHTIHEYPLVADVDGDNNSEIVIVANARVHDLAVSCVAADPGYDGERHGLYVYGDARGQWMRTRRIWNQHAYHVTNVSPTGAIPALESNNWELSSLNNYRQNVQGEGVFNAADLVVLALEVELSGCPETATLRARVSNVGNLGVGPGVPVAFRSGTPESPGPLLGVGATEVTLLPGSSTVVELTVPLEGDGPYAWVAIVDDDGTGAGVVVECDEDDNAAAIGAVDCEIIE